MKATLDDAGVVEQDAALRQAAGQAFLQHLPLHPQRHARPEPTASSSPSTSRRTSTGSHPTCRTSWTASSSATRSRADFPPSLVR